MGAVDRAKRSSKAKQSFNPRKTSGQNYPTNGGTCSRCGKSPSHDHQQCPAKDAICRKCDKKGHYQKVCRSAAKVGDVHQESSSDTTGAAFLGAVRGEKEDMNDPWAVKVQLNGNPVTFHIDTGAEVTVISEQLHKKLSNASLSPALRGPGQKVLPVKRRFKAQLRVRNREEKEEVYVVTGLHKPLLGQPAIKTLNLFARIGAIDSGKPEALFRQEYTIKVKEGAKPFALSNPRRIAIPLMEPVKEELKRMKSLGVISRHRLVCWLSGSSEGKWESLAMHRS